MQIDDRTEWLETAGLGGFAAGTTAGIPPLTYTQHTLPTIP
jgi:hypothetical protein